MNGAIDSDLYEFHVGGGLGEGALTAFAGFQVTRRNGETILTGEVQDQSALFGVLGRIEALGIQLIEVRLARPAIHPSANVTPIT